MESKITGIMMYYYKVCPKKLWYHSHNISMEALSDHVALGKFIDEHTYKRHEKHFNINDEINIDFFEEKRLVHEIKKSRKIEEASIFQVKYYLYYLEKRGVKNVIGKIDYPLLRETICIELKEEDYKEIERAIGEIRIICDSATSPQRMKKGICKECAYFDLCFA